MKRILITLFLIVGGCAVATAHECCAHISARMVSYDGGETSQAVFFKSASCSHTVTITYQVDGDIVRKVYMGPYETELYVERVYTGRRDATLISIHSDDGHEYDPIIYVSAWSSLYDALAYGWHDDDTAVYWLMATVAIVGTAVWFNAALSDTPPDYQNEYIGIGAGAGSSYGYGIGVRVAARYHAIGASLGLGLYPGSYSAGVQLHINRAYIDVQHIGMLNRRYSFWDDCRQGLGFMYLRRRCRRQQKEQVENSYPKA